MENIEYKGFTINIEHDECAESPRECDNLGTMICSHKNYNLGDKQFTSDFDIVLDYFDENYNILDYFECNLIENQVNRVFKWINKNIVILPLYLYDHSGTIRTAPFSCGWDNGQVGFIYVTKNSICKEYGYERISKARIEQVKALLISEVGAYDNYLTGNVYYYSINDGDIGSCGGFYGYNFDENGLLRCAKCDIDYHIKSMKKKHTKKLKNWIKNKVSFGYRTPLILN